MYLKRKPRTKYITVKKDYIKTLKEIIKNYKEIDENHKIIKNNLTTICNRLVTIAMTGDYGVDDEKVMQELRALNKILINCKK